MPAVDASTAAMLLQGLAANAGYVATATGLKLRLTVNAPTAAVAGTELSATGYTAGGQSCAFSAAVTTSSGASMSNSGTITWTNTGSVAWVVVGLELWDQSGSPVRKLFGLWNSQPITVGPSSTFQVAPGGLVVTFP